MPRGLKLLLLAVSLSLVFNNPATAQDGWPPKPLPGYNIFDEQQERWLGEIVTEQSYFEAFGLHNENATKYLNELGARLALKSKRPEIVYEIRLYEADEPSAVAFPGGIIYVSTGLIQFCKNEAELAGVLAHEIAHVALRQGAKTISRWLCWSIGVDKVGNREDIQQRLEQLKEHLRSTGGFQRASDLFFGIARVDEILADKYGVWNLNAAGYDPNSMVELFRRFDKREIELHSEDPWLRLLELIFSSHPPARDRYNLLKFEIFWMKKNKEPLADSEEFRLVKASLAR